MTNLLNRREAIVAAAASAVSAVIGDSRGFIDVTKPKAEDYCDHVAPGEYSAISVVVSVADKWEKSKGVTFKSGGFVIPSAVIQRALDNKLFGPVCIRASAGYLDDPEVPVVGYVTGWRFVENRWLVADIHMQAKVFAGKSVRLSSFDTFDADGVCTEIRAIDCVFLTDNPCWPDEKVPEGKLINHKTCNEGFGITLK